MKLLIVESPSKANTINQYLGKDFVVKSSYGHIRGLPSEEGAVLPDENFKMRYAILDRSSKYLSEIIKQYKKCSAIYLATDPDREGEAISWHLLEALKEKKALKPGIPIKRVVFHEITKRAISEAMEHPRDIDENLVHAQQTRQALDYLVGFTLSPVLWRKLPGSRSAGRVQSVALRMICERENEIEKFISQEYWSIEASFSTKSENKFTAMLINYQSEKLEKFSITNKESADNIVSSLQNQQYKVVQVNKKQVKRQPSPPFTTSTMLQEAARKLGYSAKKTSKLAQGLYEGMAIDGNNVGLITYMRTDSVTISNEAMQSIRTLISDKYGKKFLPPSPRAYKTKTKNAQEAHEAIRPTHIEFSPQMLKGKIEDDHFRLYELIWKRAIASQMENAILDAVAIDISNAEKAATFRATGSTINFEGYLKVYQEGLDEEDEEKKQILPELKRDDLLKLLEILPNQHFTQPPPRFTEATLVKSMEELGIGRPSTYPNIISILQDREYVSLDKRRFFPHSKGRLVSAFLSEFFTKYVDYNFTANLEDLLDDIAHGRVTLMQVLKDFWTPFKHRIDEVLQYKNVDIIKDIEKTLTTYLFGLHDQKSEGQIKKCPSCTTGTLGLKTGKYGAFVGCSNYPECKYIKPIHQEKEATENDSAATGTEFPKILGKDEQEREVSLRKGPYGLYIQVGEGKEMKRVGIPKGKSISEITLPYALGLALLPRVVGDHPQGGQIKAGIGRFGPYLFYDGKYKSLKNDDPVTVTLERALDVLNQVAEPRKARKPAAKKASKKK